MTTKTIPLTQKDFAWTKWSPKQIASIGKEAILYKKNTHKVIKNILPEKRTFENTVYALTQSMGEYGNKLGFISLLTEVSTNKLVRDAGRDTLVSLSQQLVDIEYDRDIYIALCEYAEGNFDEEKKNLRKEDIKLFNEMLRDYKRMGFDLPTGEMKKLKDLLKKGSKLGNLFDKNITEHEDFILCTKEELAGLAENVVASFPYDVQTKKYKVTLQYPHWIPFMSFAANRKKREELAKKELQKGGKQNVKVLLDMIAVRASTAKLLGYQHHADFRTEDRMAKNASNVIKMQDGLIKKVSVVAKKDMNLLRAHAKTLGIANLEFYDVQFVANNLKSKLYDINPEEVREYFQLNVILEQMFALFGGLFGITIVKAPMNLWHKEAEFYQVNDTKTKSLIGYFALDLFPREGKFGHACCVNLIQHKEESFKGDTAESPFSVILCNFPKPMKKGKTIVPSLINIRDTETLFHEFGHCLHGVLSKAVHAGQSGTSVARDFVETPSQIMENWVWNDEMLTKLSKHYLSGKVLPKDMRRKVLEGRNFQNGYTYMCQLIFTKLDMDMHIGLAKNPQQAYRDLVKKYLTVELPLKETLFPAGLGHMNGYDAGYYGYLWALVYACDAFSEFEKHGLRNKDLGMKWRREVLEKGSSEDEMKLIKNFLGRAPNQKAFLKEVVGK